MAGSTPTGLRHAATAFVYAALTFAIAVGPAAAVTPIDWPDLKDPTAARYEDAFEHLYLSELRSLAAVYRIRNGLKSGGLTLEERAKLERRLKDEEAKLAAAGIQTDQLLAQRDEVARRRAEARLQGNSDLAGKDVAITGYVIPVLDETGAAKYGYLVSGYGMCSHVPAPAPNQIIFYRLEEDWAEAELYKPVLLQGRLDLSVSRQTINLLDGDVTITASFDMDVTDIRALEPQKRDVGDRGFRSFTRKP
ncbi:DUF3299 domain-containing protein [Roseibium sp.]|uniref:DUF3299 domain-containing protein n=1 Tax=Roseibium sp. TaxID=1936156 RepID=UPI003BAABB0F